MAKSKQNDSSEKWGFLEDGVAEVDSDEVKETAPSRSAPGWLPRILIGLRIFAYLTLFATGSLAYQIFSTDDYLSAFPVLLGWTTLLIWFGFYHWAALKQKHGTEFITYLFTVGTSGALASFCLDYSFPKITGFAAQSETFLKQGEIFTLKIVAGLVAGFAVCITVDLFARIFATE